MLLCVIEINKSNGGKKMKYDLNEVFLKLQDWNEMLCIPDLSNNETNKKVIKTILNSEQLGELKSLLKENDFSLYQIEEYVSNYSSYHYLVTYEIDEILCNITEELYKMYEDGLLKIKRIL